MRSGCRTKETRHNVAITVTSLCFEHVSSRLGCRRIVGALIVVLACSAMLAAQTPAGAAERLATCEAAWQTIRDAAVDDPRTEQEWSSLHAELSRRAAAARDDDELRLVLRDLLLRIGKSHFDLLPEELSRTATYPDGPASQAGDAGFSVAPIGEIAVVWDVSGGGPADAAGIRRGWQLVSIDGRRIVSEAGRRSSADAFRFWAYVTGLLRGVPGSSVSLGFVSHEGQAQHITLHRAPQPGQPVRFGHLPTFFARFENALVPTPAGSAALLRFNVWMTALSPAIDAAIERASGTSGCVIDLRQNPGGVLTMLMGVAGHFVDAPVSLGTLKTRDTELKLVANPRLVTASGDRVEPYRGKVAILVDETSYSASEIFAAGLQAIGRARVFGSRTPGGALPAMLRRLPNGDVLEYAIGDFVTASGDRVEGRGVIPDVSVPVTRADLERGEDPVLARALAWIGGGASEGQ
jgi:carboxyl-terminal processing protease